MSETATATRPPAKPLRRSSPVRSTAKHHLEPNPFEKSFSSGPSSSESIERRADLRLDNKTNLSTPPLSTRPGAAYRDRTFSNSKNQTSPQESGSTPKPLLPPVASITSPAGETNPYPWSAGLTSSLRSGPLSPAMLAGPQSSHFDPNSFRTGFTPDLSNFKTGLTPLGGSMSFPPPSPNTAAFLAAMVTNTSGASTSAATITPNTLSALTNAAVAATNGGSMDPSAAGGAAAGAALSTQPQSFAGKPSDPHNAFDFAFSRSFPNERADAKHAGSKLKAELRGGDSDRSLSQSISPQMMQKPLDGANGDQQNAASGLFLLSRAHQEMSKRDTASTASTSLYESRPPAGKKGGSKNKLAGDAKPNGNKRKKSNSADDSTAAAAAGAASSSMNAPPPAKAAKTAKGGKKGAAAAAATAATAAAAAAKEAPAFSANGGGSYKSENGGDDDDQQWDSDDNDEDGKGNTDEKRKNFLERNRQAALKCRQRKKAWLASLQAKVEYLQNDNENLQNTVGALRNENMFLKSQLVQATGGAPLPAMPMGMPMGLPMAPPPHGVDPHHSMAPAPMGIPAGMAPHPAYMHPGASGPPMTQGIGGAYAPHGLPRGGPGGPGGPAGFGEQPQQQQSRKGGAGRPRSEGDVLAAAAAGGGDSVNGIRHEREWSSTSADASRNGGSGSTGGASATIKV